MLRPRAHKGQERGLSMTVLKKSVKLSMLIEQAPAAYGPHEKFAAIVTLGPA